MALQKEIWINSIVEGLFADNTFAGKSIDHSAFVQGSLVHVPNAGAAATVVKNGRSFTSATPAAGVVTNRVDEDLNYNINVYSAGPVVVYSSEVIELSYDKRNSVLSGLKAGLGKATSEDLLLGWLPTNYNKIPTSGEAVAAHLPGATNKRKLVTLSDIRAVRTQLDKADVPLDGRFLLLDADMYGQLLDAMTMSQQAAFLAQAEKQTGVVGNIYGIDIMLRSTVLATAAAGTGALLPLASGNAATGAAAGIAWSKYAVSRALGNVTLFDQDKSPVYFGDVLSAEILAGGSNIRNDGKGVVVLYQGTPAS
jgi:hypothetical protein